jgi:hypothetical protein
MLAVANGVLSNFALAFTALHTLYVDLALLPEPLRPGWLTRLGLVACSVFYTGISVIAFHQQWPRLMAWVTSR